MQVGNAFLTKAEERRDGSPLSVPPRRSHIGFRSAVKMKNGNFVLSSNEAVVGTVCSCAHYALYEYGLCRAFREWKVLAVA